MLIVISALEPFGMRSRFDSGFVYMIQTEINFDLCGFKVEHVLTDGRKSENSD